MRLSVSSVAVSLVAAIFISSAHGQASIPYRRTIAYIPNRPYEYSGRYVRVNANLAGRQPATSILGRSTTSLGIQTTINVPDGGAALAGGNSSASDGRNEFGVPGAGRTLLPGRGLNNAGFGRTLRNTSVSVSARVIRLAEEEERQTGVRP